MNQTGFTLPELLVASTVIVALAVGASFLLHPRDFSAADRNSQRRLDLAVLLQATRAYKEEKGRLPPSIKEQAQLIGSAKDASNLCPELVPDYLNAMPRDPLTGKPATLTTCTKPGATYTTGFTVLRSADGQHALFSALLAEQGEEIKLTF